MTALREEIIDYVKLIPEEKLTAIQPLLFMLSGERMVIEKLSDNDLTADERLAFETAEREYKNSATLDFNDYLFQRGI